MLKYNWKFVIIQPKLDGEMYALATVTLGYIIK